METKIIKNHFEVFQVVDEKGNLYHAGSRATCLQFQKVTTPEQFEALKIANGYAVAAPEKQTGKNKK